MINSNYGVARVPGTESNLNKGNVQIFQNNEFGQVRTTVDENGEPLFCLKDVAECLGYSRPADAVTDHCKGVVILPTPTQNQYGATVMQNIKFGKESEVYRLVMRSKTPNAEKFQDWVCGEVLPSIRKTGSYVPRTFREALVMALEAEDRRIEAEKKTAMLTEKIVEFAPKVDNYEQFLSINDSITVSCVAKKFGMSATKLNRILKDQGVQYKPKGRSFWLPKQGYEDWFMVKDVKYDKDTRLTNQARVTSLGEEKIKEILVRLGYHEQMLLPF